MNIFIVSWHPESKSFNSEMVRVAQSTLTENGNTVVVSDLYAMNFHAASDRRNFISVKDPNYFKQQVEEIYASEHKQFARDIELEIQKIESCDLMIWQFPLWWFGLPAVMKGWVDRVFAMGRTYGYGKIYEKGFFNGKKAMLSLTTGGAEDNYISGGLNGDILNILKPIHRGMFAFTGFSVLSPHIVYGPAHLSNEERKEKISQYADRLKNIQNELTISVGAY